MASSSIDTLIIGQGIAGSALAWQLIQRDRQVLVLDDGHASAASRVAAGLINPLAGMRFTRRRQLPDWLDAAHRWYGEAAAACGDRVLHPLPMLRLFRSVEQYRFYARRRDEPGSEAYLGEAFGPDDCPEPVAAPHGGFVQRQTGYVDLPRLLSGMRQWLVRQGSLQTKRVTHAAIEPTPKHVQVGPHRAQRVVFCDGARLVDNPWFAWLPLAPDRGELLTLRCNDWRPRHIINGAHWLVPQLDGTLRFGATHGRDPASRSVSAAGRERLGQGLAALAPGWTFEVLDQQAGVRPGTPDRYPLIGRHPQMGSLWVCNGFGARGTLTAPWYAEALARHLVDGTPLPDEATIQRFAQYAE